MAKSHATAPKERNANIVENVIQAFSTAIVATAQYGKEVVTGEQFKDNFFKDTGVFDQWVAHGFTEVANVWLHGHAAPMYTSMQSPDVQTPFKSPEVQPSIDQTATPSTEPVQAVESVQAAAPTSPAVVPQQSAVAAPKVEPVQPETPERPDFEMMTLEQHMEEIQSSVQMNEPEQELSK